MNRKNIFLHFILFTIIFYGCNNNKDSYSSCYNECEKRKERLIESGTYHASICRRSDGFIFSYRTVLDCNSYCYLDKRIRILFQFKSDGHDPYFNEGSLHYNGEAIRILNHSARNLTTGESGNFIEVYHDELLRLLFDINYIAKEEFDLSKYSVIFPSYSSVYNRFKHNMEVKCITQINNDEEYTRLLNADYEEYVRLVDAASQNSPELPNPSDSKPQNSEPTPPPKNPSAQAPNQYDSAAAQKNLQAIADTLFVKCNSEDEYDRGNSLCVNSKLHNSNLHDAFFTKYPCFSENDFKYFNAIVNGDNIFMGDPTDEDKWNDGIDYLNKEHTSACNDPAKHKSLVRPLEQSDRISYNDFKSKYPCLSDEDYKIYLDDFNQSISKGTLKIVFKDKTDLEYDNNLACDSKTESIADLLAHHVEQEIKLEEGKPSGQFFSIKQGLKPCLKNPNTCTTSIAPLVRESYVKFNRGIIATILLTNNDSFDINLFKEIQRTLLLPTTDSSERQRIANKSPVGREIMKTTKLSAEDKNNIFSIWYLRQIPYAGEEIWKESNSSNSWDYYLNRADQYLEQVSIPTPPPTNPAAQAPVQPTAIPTSPSSTESSILYNTSGSWKIQLHGNIPTSEGQKIALLLNQWNDSMNQHNADAVAKTHTNNAIIRGNDYTIEAYRDKEAKAFKKHPDFAQTPVSDVYAAPLQNKKGYYLIFDLTFSQGGKDTRTEILLVVLHDGANYKIDYESDISTDRNLIKKMEIDTFPSSKACTQLAEQILMESPQFRYDCIPDDLVNRSIVCKNNECGIGVGAHGIVVENYKFDYKSMQFTIENFNDNSEYTYTIHPKYTSQIRQLCP